MRLLSLVVCLMLALSGNAATLCVSPSSAGTADGSDWNNPLGSTWTPVRGNTYYLSDGAYGSKTFSAATNTSSMIYVLKATVADHGVATGWTDALGDGVSSWTAVVFSTSFWELNGTTGGGPSGWTNGHGFIFTNAACASGAFCEIGDACQVVNVKRCSFSQIGNTEACATATHGIYNAAGNGTVYGSTWSYNSFDNLGGLPFFLREGSNNIIEYNWLGNICGQSVFDVNTHCEGVVIHGMSHSDFRYNMVTECPSSGGFVKNDVDTSTLIRIYGNVFSGGGNFIAINTGSAISWRVVNNTFALQSYGNSGPVGGDVSVADYVFMNNITVSNSGVRALFGTHAWNWFSLCPGVACFMLEGVTENICDACSGGCDSVTTYWNPFVNINSKLHTGFALSGVLTNYPGTNFLAVEANSVTSTFQLDMLGNTRGADGVWDRGAIEFGPVSPLGQLNIHGTLRVGTIVIVAP